MEEPFEYSDTWSVELTSGPNRLVIAPSQGQVDLLIELSSLMPEPYFVLYVLVVPRISEQAGRYQSPSPLSRVELIEFLNRFRDYFEHDGRHDLWIGAPDNSFVLVYDRHDVIYAYGELDVFKQRLRRRGLREVSDVIFPSPDAHMYNAGFDADETSILKYTGWTFSPLTDQDEL